MGRASPQAVSVADMRPAREDRRDQDQHLAARSRIADALGQSHHLVHESFEAKAD